MCGGIPSWLAKHGYSFLRLVTAKNGTFLANDVGLELAIGSIRVKLC